MVGNRDIEQKEVKYKYVNSDILAIDIPVKVMKKFQNKILKENKKVNNRSEAQSVNSPEFYRP